MGRLLNYRGKLKLYFHKHNFRKILPLIYLFFLAFGIILTLVYAFIPSFVACSSIFGKEFCTPFGIFLILAASLPGYIISGNILWFAESLPWGVSFLIVITTSVGFYYFIGFLIDKYKKEKINAEKISKLLIFLFFFILLLLFIGLK